MSRLSPEARALVKALRADGPSDPCRARLRSRVLSASVVTAGTLASASAAAEGAASAAGAKASVFVASKALASGLALKLCAATVVFVVAAYPLVQTRVASRPAASLAVRSGPAHGPASEPRPAFVPMPVPLGPATSEAGLAEPSDAPVANDTPLRVTRVPTREKAARPRQAAASSSTLAEESALVARALEALRDGRREQALSLLAQHAASHPHGRLAPERERIKQRVEREGDVR